MKDLVDELMISMIIVGLGFEEKIANSRVHSHILELDHLPGSSKNSTTQIP